MTRSRGIGIAAFLAGFHLLLAYGLPPALFALLAIGLGVVCWRGGVLAGVTAVLSLAVVTGLYALILNLTGFEDRIYYRPHEKLLSYDYRADHRRYRPDAALGMTMPHGDLQSMTAEKIGVPRAVEFRTDRDGFRNDRGYHGQRYVLLGDSFVVGVGDSQADTLDAQLRRDHGLDTYNLGHPGGPADYVAYVRGFRARHGEDFKLLLFLFEGNDFPDELADVGRPSRPGFVLFWKRYYALFADTAVYRVTKSLTRRIGKRRAIEASEQVRIRELNGRRMAFYAPYIEASERREYRPGPGMEAAIDALAPNLAHIYYVPTKYRVYRPQLDPGVALPDAHWTWLDELCRRKHLACTNLTAPLSAASAGLVTQGRLTYWPDDSHWNRDGMAVAARVVAESLGPATAPAVSAPP